MSASDTICVSRIFRPKPYEVDFTGFLSNTVALRWMEDMRVDMMRDAFASFGHELRENLSVIAEAHINYLRPITYTDVIVGQLSIALLSLVKWRVDFTFRFADRDVKAITAHQVGVFIDAESHRPRKIPSPLVDAIGNVPRTPTGYALQHHATIEAI
ncbi:acyl-CoA thioesterase [Dyella monticola]|uniref:Acyl-CoA thioesterase n=1 Tax=Dyella monticola TaxID=1927958 RepID=A0A370X1M7_9GAMM|nr:acyl-CoA thioesterase [Dyella monticola]